MALHVVPLSLKEANEMVTLLHRHHKKVVGHRFSIGVVDDDGVPHGAAIIGRPVARMVDWRRVAEVTRLVTDGTSNACSMLYGAAARAAAAQGFESVQTYILASETGTTLKAAGWTRDGFAGGGSWNRGKRSRVDDAPTELKIRWSRALNAHRPAVRYELVAA